MTRASVAASVLIACCLAGCSGGSSSPAMSGSSDVGPGAGLTASDRYFIAAAAYGNWSEADLGRLAQRRSSERAVRNFGAMMIRDHTDANKKLAQIAGQHDVTLPQGPDPARLDAAAALGNLSGPSFDQQYIQQQIVEHNLALVLYQAEADTGADPGLRAYAANFLPFIRQHASAAHDIAAMRVSSR